MVKKISEESWIDTAGEYRVAKKQRKTRPRTRLLSCSLLLVALFLKRLIIPKTLNYIQGPERAHAARSTALLAPPFFGFRASVFFFGGRVDHDLQCSS